MDIQNNTKKTRIVEEKDMENVELHRAESMVNGNIDILEQINADKKTVIHTTVYEYIGHKARSAGIIVMQSTAEVVMFLYMFSYISRTITATSMVMDKVCRVHLQYPTDICQNLPLNPGIKSEVEKLANNYQLGHSLLSMGPAAILALFIGAWSDKYGRKPPIILALVGIIIDGFGTTISAYYSDSRLEYYFIPAIFNGLSGGFIGVLLVLYSYASDVSSSGKRTMKYAIMELAFGISMPLGSVAGGWIFKFYGYVPVFLTSTCGHILGLFCVIFFLEETKGLDNNDSWLQKFKTFWTTDSIVGSFKATIKKRPNQGRKQIWLIILSMSIAVFSFASLAGIMFFYVHHQFDWDNTTYSTVSAVYSVIGLTLMITIVPLSKRWNIDDPWLGIAGSLSLALKNIGIGLAHKKWIYHVASLLGLLSSLGTLAGRARISKVVSKDDLGKVFAFMTTSECFLPIVGSAVVSQAFNATLDVYPGLMFLIMGVLGLIPLGVYIWISRLPLVSYEEMEDQEKQDNPKAQIKAEGLTKY